MDRQTQATIHIECQQLLNRVTMLTDDEQWQALANCYTENAVLCRPSDSNNGIVGRQAILESFQARPPRASCHVLANSVFDIVSATQVSAKSRIWLVAGTAGETLPVRADSKLMVGTFLDTLIYVDNKWLIENRKGSIELKYSYE